VSRTIRLALAGAAVAAALAPGAAPAQQPVPPGYPPQPIHLGQCTLYWRPLYVFSDDVPVTPYVPYCVW
jgi:hypothetical protein